MFLFEFIYLFFVSYLLGLQTDSEYFRACHRVEPGFIGHFPEVSIQIRIAPVIVTLVDRNIP